MLRTGGRGGVLGNEISGRKRREKERIFPLQRIVGLWGIQHDVVRGEQMGFALRL